MKFIYLSLLLILSSCTHRLDIHYYSEGDAKDLSWTKETKKLASPEAHNSKTKRAYDSSVFKIKSELKEELQNEAPTKPVNSLHVFMGDNKEKITTTPLSPIEATYNNSMGLSGGLRIMQIAYKELQNHNVDESSPIGEDYPIGFGDKIDISLTGSINMTDEYTVSSDGQIFMPNGIGIINLKGQTKASLNKVINDAVAQEYINFKSVSNLTQTRNIRVLITGKISQPGLRSMRPGTTLVDALAKAGGVLKSGSLRSIKIKKASGKLIEVDLYQLFFEGNVKHNVYLSAGDQIIVPPIGATVCLLGSSGEGIYEIKNDKLKDLFRIHGELNGFIASNRVFFEKTVKSSRREVFSIELKDAMQMQLYDSYIFEFQGVRDQVDNTVEISGFVTRPGKYPWSPGMKLSDLLNKSDGFLMNAALHTALLTRRLDGEVYYEQNGGTGISRVREQIIWVDLDMVLKGYPHANIELQRFDQLRILSLEHFQEAPKVEISGAIRKPGTYKITQNMTLGDLVKLAGNPNEQAAPGEGVIVRKVYNSNKRFFDVKMYHFDLIDLVTEGYSSEVILEDGDRVVLRTAANTSVEVSIKGLVRFPGTYVLPGGSRVSDLIQMAGGILDEADLRASVFQRDSVRLMQIKRLNELFEQTRQRLSRNRSAVTKDGLIQESYASTMELRSLNKLKSEMISNQIHGRVVVDFLKENFVTSSDNMILENGDQLKVPKKMTSIMILGHVFAPTAFLWREGLSVRDYVDMAGGYREEAGEEEVYLMTAAGEVRSAKQVGHSSLMKMVPGPGDSIMVPKQELKRSGLSVASDYVSLLRQMSEVAAIGTSLPGEDISIGIDSKNTNESVNSGSYDQLLNK